MTCDHCENLRSRIEKVKRKTWQDGLHLIDGVANHWAEYQINAAEVMRCECTCHDTWKRMQTRVGHMKEAR